jgi:PPM family protein phosphatase
MHVQCRTSRGLHNLVTARLAFRLRHFHWGSERGTERIHARRTAAQREQCARIHNRSGVAQRFERGFTLIRRIVGADQRCALMAIRDDGRHGMTRALVDHTEQLASIVARGRICEHGERARNCTCITCTGRPTPANQREHARKTGRQRIGHAILHERAHGTCQITHLGFRLGCSLNVHWAATLNAKGRRFAFTSPRNSLAIEMRISAVGLTDVGLQRDHNEDTYRCLDQYSLYMVADGMGGHRSGEVASMIAAEGMSAFFDATAQEDATWPFPIDPNLSLPENRLSASIKMANKMIFERSTNDQSMHGMGTTVVGMLFCPDRGLGYVAHVGDSRAYRVRDGKIEPLTRDHSLINDYLMMMPDMPKEALDVLPRNVITRALGMQDSVVVDLGTEALVGGDRFVLCSDGLCGQVTDEEILAIIEANKDNLDAIAQRLVEASNAAGGDDNVTVVVVGLYDD